MGKYSQRYDIIIGADIIYSVYPLLLVVSLKLKLGDILNNCSVFEHSIYPLLETVDQLLKNNHEAIFICCFELRSPKCIEVLMETAKKYRLSHTTLDDLTSKIVKTLGKIKFYVFSRAELKTPVKAD